MKKIIVSAAAIGLLAVGCTPANEETANESSVESSVSTNPSALRAETAWDSVGVTTQATICEGYRVAPEFAESMAMNEGISYSDWLALERILISEC